MMTAEQAKIDTAAEAALLRLYRLAGTQRVRQLTRAQAKGLNVMREDGCKWVLDPAATLADITEDPIGDDKNVTEQIAKSVRVQSALYLKEAHEKETAMKNATTTGHRKAKRIDGFDSDDNEYRGLSMCQIIRFAASKGATTPQAKAIAEKCGFLPAKGTVTIQCGRGRKGEKVPNVSPELSAELLGDVLPPPGKAKATDRKAETSEERAARKARKAERKAAKAAKAHKLAGHKVAV